MRAVGLDIGITSISAVVMDALSGKTEKEYTMTTVSVLGSYQGIPVCLAIGDNQASFKKNCASAMGVEKFDPYSFMEKMLEEA